MKILLSMQTPRLYVLMVLLFLHVANSSQSQGYFNGSSLAELRTHLTLSAGSIIEFSIRTCYSGGLLQQTGAAGDALRVVLLSQNNGSIQVSWSVNGVNDSVTFGEKLASDTWFRVQLDNRLGTLTGRVYQGSVLQYSVLISNATYRTYTQSIQLNGGSNLYVGQGYTGCILQGPQVLFNDEVRYVNIDWSRCSGSGSGSCLGGAGSATPSCYSHPCQNKGTCLERASGYTCQCDVDYSGNNCEDFIGDQGCAISPCFNNATCVNKTADATGRTYECQCATGFTGEQCEKDINECASNPCKNNGACSQGAGVFSCNCNGTGYEGPTCEVNINECLSNPCKNNGTCFDTFGTFTCSCLPGYDQPYCEREVNECVSNPCRNGNCTDIGMAYRCDCDLGYSGVNCEVDIDECLSNPCPAPKDCKDLIGSYRCDCKPGFKENSTGDCVDINECSSNPCVNGTCNNLENAYSCQCEPGFTGVNCEVNIDDCAGSPCYHGATCVDLVQDYRCDCLPGFSDRNCSTNINECASNPCQNNATCVDKINSYMCNCTSGWEGTLCNVDIDECKISGWCQHGASCTNSRGSFKCDCLAGFTGVKCEHNIDDCTNTSCLNGGTCTDGVNMYTCSCTPDWMGDNCSVVYDACSFTPCQNGATCRTTPPLHNYTCDCVAGYTGATCETDIDDCVGVVCPTSQQCYDLVNNYTCKCPVGFEGINCSVNIDECASNPCKHGDCIDGVGNFTCNCNTGVIDLRKWGNASSIYPTGWTGTLCEQDMNECDNKVCIYGYCANTPGSYLCSCYHFERDSVDAFGSNCQFLVSQCQIADDADKCQNGATCVNGPNNFTCNCTPGWEGDRCQKDIDECVRYKPCQNGATCTDFIADYNCSCAPGWGDKNCTTNIDECQSDPCLNGGQCIDMINHYTGIDYAGACTIAHCYPGIRYVCNCTDTGFNGTHCQFDIDDCASQPCLHGGTCTDRVKGFNCTCNLGYEGTQCEVDINECLSNPCLNNGTCLERSNMTLYGNDISGLEEFSYANASGFVCVCAPGFTGVNCQIDIDECEGGPCLNGATCSDLVNNYECSCAAGWKGRNCSENIDECKESPPCQNGATCTDLLGSYHCACLTSVDSQGKVFGGKNCSVELTGCYGSSNRCENNATCQPFLKSDGVTQASSCKCLPGYTGDVCANTTTVSMNGFSRIVLNPSTVQYVQFQLSFRTTLDSGVLFYNKPPGGDGNDYCLIEIFQSKLIVACNSSDAGKSVTFDPKVNDGEWHKVVLNVFTNSSSVFMSSQFYSKDSDTASQYLSGMFPSGRSLWNISVDNVIGAVSDVCSNCSQSRRNFIGCLRDIGHDTSLSHKEVLIPFSHANRVNVTEGCPRVPQCTPDPCSGQGLCRDDWIDYHCTCRRPYYGRSCQYEPPAATFGFGGQTSSATYTVPDSMRETLKTRSDVSFFVRTRSTNFKIFFLGNAATYLGGMVKDGKLAVEVKLGGPSVTYSANVFISDGESHFLRVLREGSILSLYVDSSRTNHPINATTDFVATTVFLGDWGTLTGSQRRRRAVGNPAIFTVRDLRIEGVMFVTSPLNGTDSTTPTTVPATNATNLEKGEQSEEQCPLQPCKNNATCSNEFWSDFSCQCTDGYKGKDCSELDFCMSVTCPGNATCNDLSDGYECLTPATFNNTLLTFSQNLNFSAEDVQTISFRMRSRRQNQLILLIGNVQSHYVRVKTSVSLVVEVNSGDSSTVTMETSEVDVLDGRWHNVMITLLSSNITVNVDGMINKTTQGSFTSSLNDMLKSGGKLYVGGMDGATLTTYKGCLDDVRLGGYLVPFFSEDHLPRNRSSHVFYMETVSPELQFLCRGDPVCNPGWEKCANSAACVDVFDAYTCQCLPGFNGTLCENNIDECVGHACENGATCVDGIANYTCNCVPGFTGWRCETNIDDCANVTCYSGGVCVDLVNGYECNCTANYTGKNCQVDIQETCASGKQCENGGTCLNQTVVNKGDLPFKCLCPVWTTGYRCEKMIDYCADGPCKNEATCISNYTISDLHYRCTCKAGFTDFNCTTNIDDCVNSPCLHGQCTDLVNGYNCTCDAGWEGHNCSQDIDECNTTQPCQNGGMCTNTQGSYTCNCTGTGYEGVNCVQDVNECELKVCSKVDLGAKCSNTEGGYNCSCSFGYEGRNCDVANCSLGNCLNSGTCSVKDRQWECSCPQYFLGDRCEIRGACVDGPCQNSGICSHRDNTGLAYDCKCTTGWTGVNCTDDVRECDMGVCKHGANCTELPGSYNCSCVKGYTDANCSTEIDECASSPCVHGKCRDLIGYYECNCTGTGYNGTNCETDEDECERNPCKNGGTCNNTMGSFNCRCPDTVFGATCYAKNPCPPGFCQNGGTCSYTLNDALEEVRQSCKCSSEYEGPMCQKLIRPVEPEPDYTLAIILGPSIGGLLIVLLIGLLIFIFTARSKRATRGVYSPSRQEMSGSRVEMGNVLKPPPEERLI